MNLKRITRNRTGSVEKIRTLAGKNSDTNDCKLEPPC